MSHFAVLVIGPDPEKQLQPFHEYECTGIEDEYVVFHPAKESMEEMQKTFEEHKEDYTSFDQFVSDYYGYNKENGIYGRRTNPNAKWDWWVPGGRWDGFLRTLDGRDVNSALKKDIDWEYKRKRASDNAAATYDYAMSFLGTLPANLSWDHISEADKYQDASIDTKKNVYWEQERCKAWKKEQSNNREFHNHFGFFDSPDNFLIPRETYIKNAADRANITYAFVKDSQWYEKGTMGWFGISTDEMDEAKWNEQVHKALQELPDDTEIHVIDCHI